MALNTPILLITFNRPDRVRVALTEIRKQQPKVLYVAQDGPREMREDDKVLCEEVRQVVKDMVNWPCQLYTLYSDVNLGCGRGPVAAMSWFFSQVEYGIILEDDIIPHPIFWTYMEDLLMRYKDDDRVGMVCGHNLQREYYGNTSYYFTNKMAGTLGWGTWARVWKNFDFDIEYDYDVYEDALKNFYHLPPILRKRSHVFQQRVLSGSRHDCWDYQWDYFLVANKYLNIRPNSCLTSHEGNDGNGTHTYYNPNYYMDVHEERFTPIVHPKNVSISRYVVLNLWLRECRALVSQLLTSFRFKKK